MSDILVIRVATPTRYANANHLTNGGFQGARKSPEYIELFRSVREAARVAIDEASWVTATFPCDAQVVRYSPKMRPGDPANLGKAELDALQPSTAIEERRDKCAPFRGVWANDSIAKPFHAMIEYDPAGEDRIYIVVRRRFPEYGVAMVAPSRVPKPRLSTKKLLYSGGPIPSGFAVANGVLVPKDEVLRKLGRRR